MILDELLEFADNVTVAATAGTALIGDQIDLGTAHRDIGDGEPVWFVITTGSTEIITAGSAGTIIFRLVSDSTASIAVDGSATVHLSSPTFVTDDAAANSAQLSAGGLIFAAPLPLEGTVYERYLGVLCVTATADVTAGTINAFLTKDVSKWVAYADASN